MRELEVRVVRVTSRCGARLKEGDRFYVRGKGRLELPAGQQMCIYALNSILPFVILKQREPSPGELWIPESAEVACPDPHGVVFEIREI